MYFISSIDLTEKKKKTSETKVQILLKRIWFNIISFINFIFILIKRETMQDQKMYFLAVVKKLLTKEKGSEEVFFLLQQPTTVCQEKIMENLFLPISGKKSEFPIFSHGSFLKH